MAGRDSRAATLLGSRGSRVDREGVRVSGTNRASMQIRQAAREDCGSVTRIYNHYVSNSTATFEVTPLDVADMEKRWAESAGAALPWLVAVEGGEVIGYALASKWKGRCAYRHTVECSIYLDPSAGGRGVGSRLYEALFAILRESDIHVVIGGISLPNPASVALHEKFKMEKVAHFKEVGYKFARWIDVGYWQTLL